MLKPRDSVRDLLMVFFLTVAGLALTHALDRQAQAESPEEIWRSLERLPPAERDQKLVAGSRNEGRMIWYTNSGSKTATRLIQSFKNIYPFIDTQVWRSTSRQVAQRAIAEARAGRHRVDVVKPSTDLMPVLLDAGLLGRYESPARSAYPEHATGEFQSNLSYAFRIFSYDPRRITWQEVPKTWHELLHSHWKREILFDKSSLAEAISLIAAWGKHRTAEYLGRLSQQEPLIRLGRTTSTQMMMAGEALLSITSHAASSETLRAGGAPVDWVAQDVIPALMHPLTIARNAPHPYSAALFYDFLLSRQGQQLIAREGLVVAHPKVDPVYVRMKELQALLGTSRVQLNTIEQNRKFYEDGIQLLHQTVLHRP
jgi:iron(III) transport system substrate-binding protein